MPPEETTQKSEMESRFRFCRKLLREKALTEKVLRYENKGLREHTEFLERELQALRDEVKLLQEDAKKRLPPPFWKKMQEYKALLREKLFPIPSKGHTKSGNFTAAAAENIFSLIPSANFFFCAKMLKSSLQSLTAPCRTFPHCPSPLWC